MKMCALLALTIGATIPYSSAFDVLLKTGRSYTDVSIVAYEDTSIVIRHGRDSRFPNGQDARAAVKIPLNLLTPESVATLRKAWEAKRESELRQQAMDAAKMRIWIRVSFFREKKCYVSFRVTNGRTGDYEEAGGEYKDAWLLGKAPVEMDQGSAWFINAWLLGRLDDDSRDYVFTQNEELARRVILEGVSLYDAVKAHTPE